MKKLTSIFFPGLILVCFIGTANATVAKWKSATTATLGSNGYYQLNYKLSGFNPGKDQITSGGITFKVGSNKSRISLPARIINQLNQNGSARYRVKNKFGGGSLQSILVAKGKPFGGGSNNSAPEPGMLALMALVLLGLGLGPRLRKIRARSIGI